MSCTNFAGGPSTEKNRRDLLAEGEKIFIKCIYFITILGLPNTSGLRKRVGKTATKDADVIILMRRAGAIPIAVTNCSELCMWYESSNLVYGRTNNAYHAGRIVGGSSGMIFSCVCSISL